MEQTKVRVAQPYKTKHNQWDKTEWNTAERDNYQSFWVEITLARRKEQTERPQNLRDHIQEPSIHLSH